MKTISPPQILTDQIEQLHCMETQIARTLPILAGSVLNVRLRRWLSCRARRARERRDQLKELLDLHPHSLASKSYDSIRSILTEGNRDLARIHHPYSRDVAMIEHCIRIEQHARTAYGIAVPLTHRIGFPQISVRLKLLLTELETARHSYHAMEAELFAIAACHPQPHVGNSAPAASIKYNGSRKSSGLAPLAVGY